jgi:hypothetical protein
LIQLMVYIFDVNIFNFIFLGVNMLTSLVIITFFMAFASVKFRDKYLDHKINFLKCWMIGLIVGFVALIIGTLYSFVFNNFLDPQYIENQIKNFSEWLIRHNVPEENLDEIMADMKNRMSPLKMVMQSLMMMGSISFFMSMLATLFVRKKEKVSETTIY